MQTLPPPGTLAVAAIAAVLCWPSTGSPSPFEDTTLGGAVFTGPAHPHATAIYVNPAALGLDAEGTHLYLDGSLRLDQLHIEPSVRDPGGELTDATAVEALTLSPAGTLAAYNVGSKVSAGVAVGYPMNEEFIAEKDPLGYHVLGGHHRRLAWLTLGMSLRLTGSLYLGTGLSLTATSLELSFLRDTALEGGSAGIAGDCNGSPCGIANPDAAERYDIDVGTEGRLGLATQNIAFSGGLMYQVAHNWWLGVAVQSPAGFNSALSLRGDVLITPSPRDRREDSSLAPYEARAEVVYRLPQSVAVALRGPILRGYELVTAVQWQNYSRHDQFDVRIFGGPVTAVRPEWYPRYRGLRDVVVLEGGLEGVPGPRVRWGGRLRVETGATSRRALSPLQIAGPSVSLVTGGELRLSNNLTVSGSYGFTYFATVSVDDSLFEPGEYLDCVDMRFDIDACAAAAEGRAVPTAAGTYGRLSHAARVSVRYDWF